MFKNKLKRKIKFFWPENMEARKIILLYHSLGDGVWKNSLTDFNNQLEWLSEHCQFRSLTELIHASPSPKIQIAVTFDDGYQSLYQEAAPLFSKYKIRPTVYLNTDWIGLSDSSRKASVAELGHYPDDHFLTWPEVKELQEAGWEIGSHGANHYDLSLLDEDALKIELFKSKQAIEQELGLSCIHFAYPWGRYTPQLKKMLKDGGYSYATVASHGSINGKSDPFALPRISISNQYSMQDFGELVKGQWDFMSWIHRLKGI